MAITRRRRSGRVNVDISDELWRALMYKANILGYRSRIENELARENEADAAERQHAEYLQQLQNAGGLSRQKASDEAALTRQQQEQQFKTSASDKALEEEGAAVAMYPQIAKSLSVDGTIPSPVSNKSMALLSREPDRLTNFYRSSYNFPNLQKQVQDAEELRKASTNRQLVEEEHNKILAPEFAKAKLLEQQSKSIHNVGSSALIPSEYSSKYDAITGATTGTTPTYTDYGGIKMKTGEETTQFPPSITKLSGSQSGRGRTIVGKDTGVGGISPFIARPEEPATAPVVTPAGEKPKDVAPKKEAGATTQQDFQGVIPAIGQAASNAITPRLQQTADIVKPFGQLAGSVASNAKTFLTGGNWQDRGLEDTQGILGSILSLGKEKIGGLLSKIGSGAMPRQEINPLQQAPQQLPQDLARQIQAQKLINSWSQLTPEQQDNGMLQEEKQNQERLLYSKPTRRGELEQPNYGLEYEDEERYRRSPFNFLNY